ncbi:MAG: hypothetical protein WD557_02080 [Dehalococcoidia bacterium]
MPKLMIELSDRQVRELARLATKAGRTPDVVAAELIGQAMDPWTRAWEIVERARQNAAMADDEAMALAVSEVAELRRERRRTA